VSLCYRERVQNLGPVLAEIEHELTESEAELARLTERVTYLRQAAEGLRGLMQKEDRAVRTGADLFSLSSAEQNAASSANLSNVPGFRERPDSHDGVLLILKEHADSPVHIEEVRAQFRERDWIPSDWSKPDSAIYMALVRAEKRDQHVVRVDRRHWLYRSDIDQTPEPVADQSADRESAGEEQVASPT